jgi:hypothetical protein
LFVLSLLAVTVIAPVATAQACTITWVGGVASAPTAWYGFDPHGVGTGDDQYNWNQQRFPDFTDDVCFPAGSVASTQHVDQNTPNARSIAISAGATLTVSDVDLAVHENSTNAGTLIMAGPQSLLISDGDSADHEGLTNTGTIHFTPGAAGLRMILGDLLNQGTIDVDHPDASIQESGPGTPANALQTNQGTIDISPGNNLRSLNSNFINSTGGVITGGGSMSMAQARFEAAANSQIVAPTDINITTSRIAGSADSTATGNIDVIGDFNGGGPSVLEGTVPAGITLDIEPKVTLQSPPVDSTVNAGRINLNGNASQLQVLPNDTGDNSTSRLTNTGTIEFVPGASDGFRLITGNVVNQGSILVNHPQTSFQFPGGTNTVSRLTNLGSVVIAPTGLFRVLGATFAQDPAGTLAIGVSGADFGRVIGDTPIALAGTLSVQTSGAAPAIGQQFKIISTQAIRGTFGAVQETGAHYDVAYNSADVTLTSAVAPPPGGNPAACDKAEKQLDKAKAKLKKLKRHDAPAKKVKEAKKKVKEAKDAVDEACA